MLRYFWFFLFMVGGLSLWQVLFLTFAPLDIMGISLFATFFKWLYEVTWERKSDGAESP